MLHHADAVGTLLSYRLGAAVQMERDRLRLFESLQRRTSAQGLHELFADGVEEAHRHMARLHRVGELLGAGCFELAEPTAVTTNGPTRSLLLTTGSSTVDALAIGAALRAEVHAVAVYQLLIAAVPARLETARELLRANLADAVTTAERLHEVSPLGPRPRLGPRHATLPGNDRASAESFSA